uniref:Uncharacterized protein n=1 Tax=Arion vulgaris TaxID=1028688 RepID=A0A0B7AW20_9EUPU
MTATDTGYLTEENFSGLLSWEPSSRRDKLLDDVDEDILAIYFFISPNTLQQMCFLQLF